MMIQVGTYCSQVLTSDTLTIICDASNVHMKNQGSQEGIAIKDMKPHHTTPHDDYIRNIDLCRFIQGWKTIK